jgi:hypothetical protein
MLWQMLSSFHLYSQAKWDEHYLSKENIPCWGASIVSKFFMCSVCVCVLFFHI